MGGALRSYTSSMQDGKATEIPQETWNRWNTVSVNGPKKREGREKRLEFYSDGDSPFLGVGQRREKDWEKKRVVRIGPVVCWSSTGGSGRRTRQQSAYRSICDFRKDDSRRLLGERTNRAIP